MNTEHTPGPWRALTEYNGTSGGGDKIVTIQAKGVAFDLCFPPKVARDVANATAEVIVRAVNSHAELIAIVQGVAKLRPYGDGDDDAKPDGKDAMRVLNWHIAAACRALAKVKGVAK